MIRLWHKFQAWRGLHPGRIFNVLSALFLGLAVAGVITSFWFHFQDQSNIQQVHTQQTAAAAASKAVASQIDPVVCHLVYAYLHLPDPTDNAQQITKAWSRVGALIGCSAGIKP